MGLSSNFFLFSLAQSTSFLRKMFLINLDEQSNISLSWPILSAGLFVLVSVVLSMFLIFEHLAVYYLPEFLSLLDSKAAFIFEIMRDCYEAFALYCFERYLIACLGGEEKTIKLMETQFQVGSSMPLLEIAYEDGFVKHPFPLNCLLGDWYLGPEFYQAVKIGIVQYMILKTVCALIAIVLQFFGVYWEGKFEWRYGYPYLAVVLNFSQTWALYCLIQFYSVTKDKLHPINPLQSFSCSSLLYFLTWWQGVVVAFLFSTGAFKGHLAQELKTCIQDYLICIENEQINEISLLRWVSLLSSTYTCFQPRHIVEGEVHCNVSVMDDYAAIGSPLDPEEVSEGGMLSRMRIARCDDNQRRPSFPESVCDVVFGGSEIMVDDVKFTVSHVVEPMERGIARLNKTIHQISENIKQHEMRKRKAKDDSDLIPLRTWTKEFSEARDHVAEGSFSDSGLSRKKTKTVDSKARLSGTSSGSL
ncbi:hypothetical protein HPP92_004638 [Vanilla planifolia]|uniref:Uncharacterized protein n=1 Tax=Vanilla planifolia TaxID=51239 RepID=A0A835RFA8_VANPL|nr:hypothetical protein HPP92_004638 [Vanilla planifolia]